MNALEQTQSVLTTLNFQLAPTPSVILIYVIFLIPTRFLQLLQLFGGTRATSIRILTTRDSLEMEESTWEVVSTSMNAKILFSVTLMLNAPTPKEATSVETAIKDGLDLELSDALVLYDWEKLTLKISMNAKLQIHAIPEPTAQTPKEVTPALPAPVDTLETERLDVWTLTNAQDLLHSLVILLSTAQILLVFMLPV